MTNTYATTQPHSALKRLHTLLRLTGQEAQKVNLVLSFSNGRTESSRELTSMELEQLCAYLQGEYDKKDKDFARGEIMRRNIIAMAHEMGWQLQNGKADMERVNNWCLQQFGKKVLNQYTYAELTTLLSIFKEKVYAQFLKAV